MFNAELTTVGNGDPLGRLSGTADHIWARGAVKSLLVEVS